MRHDFSAIRQIPILHVAQVLGIELRRTGSGIWNVKDESDPLGYTSLTISEGKNRWKRWSGKTSQGISQGSVIDLVIYTKDCDLKTAIEFLTNNFL